MVVPKRSQPNGVVFDETDFQRNLAASLTVKEAPDRAALEAMIERAKDAVTKTYRGGGGVVVGRIQLDGPGKPTDVNCRCRACLAVTLQDRSRVSPCRSACGVINTGALDAVLPAAGRGSFVDLGTLQMRRIPAADLLLLTGKLSLEGDTSPTTATVSLSESMGTVNTPGQRHLRAARLAATDQS